jgi:hypothetical protein
MSHPFLCPSLDSPLHRRHPPHHQSINPSSQVLEESFTLPDGRVIKLGRERFEAAEALFNPGLIDVDSKTGGIGEMVFRMIQQVIGCWLVTGVLVGWLIGWLVWVGWEGG